MSNHICLLALCGLVSNPDDLWQLTPPRVRTIEAEFEITFNKSKSKQETQYRGKWVYDIANYREKIELQLVDDNWKNKTWVSWDGEVGFKVVTKGNRTKARKTILPPQELLSLNAPRRYVFPFFGMTLRRYIGADETLIESKTASEFSVFSPLNHNSFFHCQYATKDTRRYVPAAITLYVTAGPNKQSRILDDSAKQIGPEKRGVVTIVKWENREGIEVPTQIEYVQQTFKSTLTLRYLHINKQYDIAEFQTRFTELSSYYDEFRRQEINVLGNDALYDIDEVQICKLLNLDAPPNKSDVVKGNCATAASYCLFRLCGKIVPLHDVQSRLFGTSPKIAATMQQVVNTLHEFGLGDYKALSVPIDAVDLIERPFIAFLQSDNKNEPGHYVVVSNGNHSDILIDYPHKSELAKSKFGGMWKGQVIAVGLRMGTMRIVGYIGVIIGAVVGTRVLYLYVRKKQRFGLAGHNKGQSHT